MDVPIIKIDDAMAERAVELGRRIGLMCTARSTLEPSRDIISSHAARLGKEVVLTSRINEDLVAGVRVYVGSQMIDQSVQGRLEDLRKKLEAAPLPA